MICYVYVNLGVILYESINIVDITGCFNTTEWCGCDRDDHSVMIGWYRVNVTDGESWRQNDYTRYLTKIKCGKPVGLTIHECINYPIIQSFDYAGSVYCPSNHFMTAIKSSAWDLRIFQWERIFCCNFIDIGGSDFYTNNFTSTVTILIYIPDI